MPRRRSARIAAIAFGVFVFLGISFMLARALTQTNAERARVLDVLRAQARGDAGALLSDLPDCAALAACAQSMRERVGELARPGEVEILNFRPSVQLALRSTSGTARVAWQIRGSRSPIVQCVRVRRDGPLSGGGVELVAISSPIRSEGSCP